jgi:two-component system, NarL family, sensor kinase
LRRKTRQLELLNAKLTRLQEEQRRRIARDLHDSVGQLLVAISMNHTVLEPESHKLSADAAQCLSENAVMVAEVSKQIRTISYLLHPPLLDEAGIASALRCYVDGFSRRSKISVALEISDFIGRLPHEIEISVFRLVQECLTNIHRHSGSRTAEIRLTRNEACLWVEIEDSGKGIPVAQSARSVSTDNGLGLHGLRERLRLLGGTLDIHSNEHGTRLTAVIPIPNSSALQAQTMQSADSSKVPT